MRRHIAVLILLVSALLVAAAAPASAAPGTPLPPTGLSATAVSSTEVVLTWNPADGATGYEVWWGDIYFSEYLATTTQTTFRHTSLGPGGTYGYAVRTVTRKGSSQLSGFVQVQTPPEAPTLVSAEVIKADEVQLFWQPGLGDQTYAISEVTGDGVERPSTVLQLQDRSAIVRTVAETGYAFRIRGVNGTLQSLGYGSVEITTPAREPSVTNVDTPGPVPAGDTVLAFRVVGQNSFQPTYGTLAVSIDGGQATTVAVNQTFANLNVRLEPGTHTLAADYSGDGAFLPSHLDYTFYAVVPAPGFEAKALEPPDVPAATVADVTCDGITDLISASQASDGTGSALHVRPGQADGTLGAVRSTALPWSTNSVAAGDLNRDGCADVAVLGTDLLTFTGTPSGLVAGTRVRAGGLMSNLTLHDITHDGQLDAVVNDSTGIVVLPGNGRGGFGRSRTIVPEMASYAVGDLDGDGVLEVVTSTGSGIHAWKQDAMGQFVPRWRSGHLVSALAVDDLTGDGRAEVVAAAEGITVLSGQNGSQVGSVPGVFARPTVLTTGDINGDGARDIVSMDGAGGGIGVSLTHAGAPTALQYRPVGQYGATPRGVLLADLSHDGRTDVVIVDYIDGLVLGRQVVG